MDCAPSGAHHGDMTSLHPDRLLPTDPATRAVAHRLYAGTAELLIVSPLGHVPAQWLADDTAFGDPTSLPVSPSHLDVVTLALEDAGTGHDVPVGVEPTRALLPLLERFGTADGFQMVLFTEDETTLSREIAPLAGFYPSVYAGAPWWFLDAPAAVHRYREAVTETAGFCRTSGFVDDTRASLSIPARRDMARRLDAGYLAELVAGHQLDEDEALETAVDLVTTIPQRTFKL